MIYLDYNATTPHDPDVVKAMRPFLETHYGNPSSTHGLGQRTHEAVEVARGQVAHLLSCSAHEVIFTSGGTEANNHAIKGLAFARRDQGNHIITSQIEHPAVTEVCGWLEGQGFDITYLPVDDTGQVSVGDVASAIRDETILITVMHANNEVGTIQPVQEIVELFQDKEITVHTDAAQSIGKIGVDVERLGVDMLSIAGHKLYAPKGIGALYVRNGIELEKFMHGAGHEGGRRAGTENVLEIVGLGRACELIQQNLDSYASHMMAMRDLLEANLLNQLPDVQVNGDPDQRLPNTLSVSFRGVNADDVLAEIGDVVAGSAGAACHSGDVSLSHVISAMKMPLEWARGTLRLSVGRLTTKDEIEQASRVIIDAVKKLRAG